MWGRGENVINIYGITISELSLAQGALAFGLAFAFACLLVPLIGRVYQSIGLVDEPDRRKPHQGTIPLSGGSAVLAAALASGLVLFGFNLNYFDSHPMLLWGTAVLLITGLLDDYYELRASIRLIIQLLVATGVVYWEGLVIRHIGLPFGTSAGTLGLNVFAEPLTILAIVMMINAINMLDGLDGLLGGVVLLIFGSLLYVGLLDGMDTFNALALLTLMGGVLGFLVWNYRGFDARQAKFFLGDSGSMTLGFLVAYLAINTAMDPHATASALVPPITVAWIVALPAAEMVTMIYKRMIRGKNPMAPDQTHLHHLLMRGGFSPWQSVTLVHSLQAGLALVGIVCWLLGVPQWSQYLMLAGFFVGYAALSLRARDVARNLRQPKPSHDQTVGRSES